MRKLWTFMVLLLFPVATLLAQSYPQIKFKKTLHDFGEIPENGGKVSYTYIFKNTGNKNLKLRKVKTSCGCTVTKWPKKAILPGKSAEIKAIFDPVNREGRVQKTISVFANTPQNLHLLTLTAKVKKKEPGVKEKFQHKIGNLRFPSNNIVFDTVHDNVTSDRTVLKVFNAGSKRITVKRIESPLYVWTKELPRTVPPGKMIKLEFWFNAKARMTAATKYGYIFDEVYLITDDKEKPEKLLYSVANIRPGIPAEYRRDKKNAPHISFEKTHHDFGEANEGDILRTGFKFTNTGKKVLKIKDISTSCGCTVSKLKKKTIQPGESQVIKVEFNTLGKFGYQSKSVMVYTNDPEKPEVNIVLEAQIEDKRGLHKTR